MGYYQELLKYSTRFLPEPGTVSLKTSTTGTFSDVFGSTLTLSGLASGDFVVIILTDNDNDSIPLSSGWTNISNNTGTASVRAAYIFSTGTSVSYTTPSGTDIDGSAVLAAFTGVDPTTPLDVSRTLNTGAATTSVTPASVTTVTDNCMILTALGIEGGDLTVTDPSGYTRIAKAAGGGFLNLLPSVTVLSYKQQTSSGTESPGAFSWSGNRNARTVTIALRPAS